MGFDTVRIDHCIYELLKILRVEVHKDLPKVFMKGELDCLIDFVY